MYCRKLRRTKERDAKLVYRAIESGSEVELNHMINMKADVNFAHKQMSPLLACLTMDRLELARILIQAGANINILDHERMTLACRAVCLTNVQFLDFFIENGANINVKDADGQTLLHLAAEIPGGEACMKCLLEKGAEVDVSNRFGVTPLHYAIESGSPEKVKFILMYRPNPQSIIYKDIITLVTKVNSDSIWKMTDELIDFGFKIPQKLVKDMDFAYFAIEIQSEKLWNYLSVENRNSKKLYNICKDVARHTEHENILKLLMDFRLRFRKGQFLIEDAINCNDASTVEMVLNKFDHNQRELSTFLFLAIFESSHETLEILLKCKHTEINLNSMFGSINLINFAADSNNWMGIELLCQFGADINCLDKRGNTPLHVACRNKDSMCIKTILMLGGDINLVNNEGQTPPELLEIERNPHAYELMRKHITALHLAGFFINDANLFFLDSEHNSEEMFHELKSEVEALKVTRISGTTISYFNLLRSSEADFDKFLNNELIATALDSEAYKHQFTYFGNFICNQYTNSLKRKKFYNSFIQNNPCFNQFPYICLNKIISFISTEDLGIMAGKYPRRIQSPCPLPNMHNISVLIRNPPRRS